MLLLRRTWFRIFLGALLLGDIAGGAYFFVHAHAEQVAAAALAAQYKTPQEAGNVYVRFDMEAYDDITVNYWQTVQDTQLAQLFQLSVEKAAASTSVELATSTRAGTAQMLETVFNSATSTDEEKQLAVNTLTVLLYNLAPTGRSQLLSQAQVTQLRQEVSNVNPSTDLYGDLGLPKGASTTAVEQAYQQKAATATTTAQKQQLAYADQVLTNANDKARYDQAQIQPTVFSHIIGDTLYLDLSQIAPTTVQEFAEAVDAASTTPGLSSMILDLRGNIGGALDFTQYFTGLFQGDNQYAFDLYHQGNYEVQRTLVGKFAELDRYTDIAILTDNMTQSTAELTTATFKRLHLAHVVGATTRGWGSVENTYPLTTVIDPNTTYALLLVNSLTLRDDNQPIEGNGVVPDVSIADKNWESELSAYFKSSSLINAIEKTVTQPPLH